MKINFLEPLGISNDRLREIVDNTIGTQHEVTYYSDRNEDPAVLVKDARVRIVWFCLI